MPGTQEGTQVPNDQRIRNETEIGTGRIRLVIDHLDEHTGDTIFRLRVDGVDLSVYEAGAWHESGSTAPPSRHAISSLEIKSDRARSMVYTLTPADIWELPTLSMRISIEGTPLHNWCFSDVLLTCRDVSATTTKLELRVALHFRSWTAQFSPDDFMQELLDILERQAVFEVTNEWRVERGLWYCRYFSVAIPKSEAIGPQVGKYGELLVPCIDTAAQRALERRRPHALTSYFNFPPAIQTACEQYLVYFSQFLQDLGIEAQAELTHAATTAIFTVIPGDQNTALVTIKEALDAYLSVPTLHAFHESSLQSADLAVQQLRANVLFLQSQLQLAQATVELKDSTITNLKTTLLLQKPSPQALAGARLVSDTEPLIGDLVKVKKYDGKGFLIDLPEILRSLKRRMRGPGGN
jgi:hypothetical protein